MQPDYSKIVGQLTVETLHDEELRYHQCDAMTALSHDIEKYGLNETTYPGVVPAIVEVLKDEGSWDFTRCTAARTLGIIGNPNAVPALLEVLSDEYEPLFVVAVDAIGEIADSSAVQPLINLLKDSTFCARANTAAALGKILDESAIPVLMEYLKNDDDMWVRRSCAAALGELRAVSAVPLLTLAVSQQQDSLLCTYAACALVQVGDTSVEVLDALKQMELSRDGTISETATWALNELNA